MAVTFWLYASIAKILAVLLFRSTYRARLDNSDSHLTPMYIVLAIMHYFPAGAAAVFT